MEVAIHPQRPAITPAAPPGLADDLAIIKTRLADLRESMDILAAHLDARPQPAEVVECATLRPQVPATFRLGPLIVPVAAVIAIDPEDGEVCLNGSWHPVASRSFAALLAHFGFDPSSAKGA